MPFALTFVGLILVITGFQNTYKELGGQLQKDFTGEGNFFYWLAALGVIGGIGYIKGFETFSRAFMALMLIVLVISLYKKNPDFFNSIGTQLGQGSSSATNPIGAPLAGGSGGGGGAGAGSGFGLGDVGGFLSGFSDGFGF